MRSSFALRSAAAAAVLAMGTTAGAAIFPEVEDNNTKATANVIAAMVAGDQITGTTTGASTTVAGIASADNFLIGIPASAPGIYRNRLVITTQGTVGHTGTIRGLTVPIASSPADTLPGIPWDGVIGTPSPGTDGVIQTSSTTSTPPRYNTFYTFGKPTQLIYRVTGTVSTTAEYASTLQTVQVTPTNIGSYSPGDITLTWHGQGHTTDTEMWVYDGNLNPISGYGNDDPSTALNGAPATGIGQPAFLVRSYAPGTYYVAVSGFNMANDLASPSDDNFRTGSVMDFANVLAGGGSLANANMTFTITDGTNSLQVPNTRLEPFDVNWFAFTVVPEPTSLGLLVIGAAGLLRRRRD